MEEQVFAGFAKNAQEQVIGLIQPFGGKWLAHIRIAVLSADGDELVPTKKGVALDAERFSQLKDAIMQLGGVASRNRVVAVIERNAKEHIRVGVNEYHGDVLCYVRIFYLDSGGEWKPSNRGISIRVEQLPELEQLAAQMADTLSTNS